MGGLPDLLTIEEAARVIRVGRTKAYAMAQEWRATGGRSGLPVVDFGHVLRVPLCQLEKLVGGPLTAPVPEQAAVTAVAAPPADESPPAVPDPDDAPDRSPRRPSRRRSVGPDQPSLPFAS